MKVKCLIIDDEPLAIEVLRSHIEKIPALKIIGCCRNALEAFEYVCENKTDLLFLDIQMPGMKGTDFLRNLKNPPKVIITTAFREFALEGYDLNVDDYLVKPVSFERLFKAINKVIGTAPAQRISVQTESHPNTPCFINISINKRVQRILPDDILYAESIKDYITIHTIHKKITVKHTMTSFEALLPEKEFIRIHRSFVVRLNKISAFTASSVEVNGTGLPIGRNFKNNVFAALKCTPLSE